MLNVRYVLKYLKKTHGNKLHKPNKEKYFKFYKKVDTFIKLREPSVE